MTLKELAKEIEDKVKWLEEHNGHVIHKTWLISTVMSDHDAIVGDDREFALMCARYTIEQSVDRYFRTVRQADTVEPGDQLVLEGFERLQKRYVCQRDNEPVLVRIEHMTDEEIDAKVVEHRRMGDGHYRHADELVRYKTDRQRPLTMNA